jgi:hypothetical protein
MTTAIIAATAPTMRQSVTARRNGTTFVAGDTRDMIRLRSRAGAAVAWASASASSATSSSSRSSTPMISSSRMRRGPHELLT